MEKTSLKDGGLSIKSTSINGSSSKSESSNATRGNGSVTTGGIEGTSLKGVEVVGSSEIQDCTRSGNSLEISDISWSSDEEEGTLEGQIGGSDRVINGGNTSTNRPLVDGKASSLEVKDCSGEG